MGPNQLPVQGVPYLLPADKTAGPFLDHTPPNDAEVKESRAIPLPVSEAYRSKTRIYGLSLAGVAGLNSPRGTVFCFLWSCVLSGRGLCFWPITRLEESYWLWCVIVCDLKTSVMRRPWLALGGCAKESEKEVLCLLNFPLGFYGLYRLNFAFCTRYGPKNIVVTKV